MSTSVQCLSSWCDSLSDFILADYNCDGQTKALQEKTCGSSGCGAQLHNIHLPFSLCFCLPRVIANFALLSRNFFFMPNLNSVNSPFLFKMSAVEAGEMAEWLEHWQFFQRTWVEFLPLGSWQPLFVNSSSQRSDAFFCLLWAWDTDVILKTKLLLAIMIKILFMEC